MENVNFLSSLPNSPLFSQRYYSQQFSVTTSRSFYMYLHPYKYIDTYIISMGFIILFMFCNLYTFCNTKALETFQYTELYFIVFNGYILLQNINIQF